MSQLTLVEDRSGFPHRGFPSGWFQVAWAAQVQPGEVLPLRYFDEDLVLYRSEDGDYHVLDAHCPHMGAHLGYGGKVDGSNIVCPFHGWEWGPDGRNVLVPCDGKPTNRRTIRTWRTHVSNEIVWVWYDADGGEPTWDPPSPLPGMEDGGRLPLWPHCSKRFEAIKAKPQYITENGVDLEHLYWVHRAQGPIEWENYEIDGPCFRVRYKLIWGYGKESTWLTPDGPIEGTVVGEYWGLGYMFTYFDIPDGAISVQCQTPIDHERCDLFQSIVVWRDGEGDVPTGNVAKRVDEQIKQIDRDLPIWEHLRYQPQAPLTRDEAKPVTAVRRWAAQFYPQPEAVPAGDA